jgi:predicted lipoprotein
MRHPVPLLLIGILLVSSCVIVKHEDRNATASQNNGLDIYFANGSFNAKSYVEGLWNETLLPYAREKATDIADLISAIKADEAGASVKYGIRQVAEGAPFNFVTRGEAVVLAVQTASRAGTATLDFDGDGVSDAVLQIGPVFKGTSIRDALPFVSFDDFVNQLDYAALSNELNVKVRDHVYEGFDPATAVGRTIVFHGFFTFERGSPILITPVIIEWR